MLFIIYGFLIRPVFPISKILATPSWTAICIGISLMAYVCLYVIVGKWDRYKWARPIKAASTSTLTCYIMPFFAYPVLELMGFRWPEFLTAGIVGLAKSLLFSLAIIGLVRMLEKINIRLKI